MLEQHVWLCMDCATRIRSTDTSEEVPALQDGVCPVCGGTTPVAPEELEE